MIIDSDAHVVETPDIFTSRFPKSLAEVVPHVRYVPEADADMWFVGDTPVHGAVFSVICGELGDPIRRREVDSEADGWAQLPRRVAEMHPSSYDPNERAKVMDSFGIQAATTFPNLGVLSPDVYRTMPGATIELQLQVVSAYNDWVMTWAQQQPGRFIPLACIPYWDVEGAVKEIERCAEMGMKGLVMSGRPQIHGCPILADREWDPVWAAAQAAGLSISFHAGAGGFENHFNDNRQQVLGNEALQTYSTVAMLFENAISAVDLLMSGILQRYPELTFAIVETGVGWVPFALECLDHHYKRYQPWLSRSEMRKAELPSELFRRQVYVNVWYENLSDHDLVEHLRRWDLLGNVMFETDYPHPTCLLEEEIQHALKYHFADLTPEERDNVLTGNVMRCYGLSGADVGIARA